MVKKAVILAGGLGTRISEETHLKPKPMIEIGGKPILWHIMKIYSSHGINEFVICCGYKRLFNKRIFRQLFFTYVRHYHRYVQKRYGGPSSKCRALESYSCRHRRKHKHWREIKRVLSYLKNEDSFCFTYSDGVADVDISALIKFHEQHDKLATVTAVQPPGRYGALNIEGKQCKGFIEKPKGDGGWINGGFFVLSPKCIEYIDNDNIAWESEPLTKIAKDGEFMIFKHDGFWQPMDTLREKIY